MTASAELDQLDDATLADRLQGTGDTITRELRKVIVGQDIVVEQALIALFAGGNCLLVGVPGLAKTLLISTLARALDLKFSRIQFTPDLMPSDVTGTDVIQDDPATGHRRLSFMAGPVFANVLLADEINRTPPKTQAALLEAMQERRVTVQGRTYDLDAPFFVFATQNPIELEGTYPLPEAQLDRFMLEVMLDYLPEEDEVAVVRATTALPPDAVKPVVSKAEIIAYQKVVRRLPIADAVTRYAVKLVRATRPGDGAPDFVKQWVSYGASVRAAQALVLGSKARALLQGRASASFEDVRALARPVLRHRVLVNFQAQSEKVTTDQLIARLIDFVPLPKSGHLIVPAAPASFLDPALLARISDLALLARTVVDGFMHGQHRSLRKGSSLDFAEHRSYQPGDDLRRIDWRVYGRTDRFYIKQYDADTNASVLFALDQSGSMDFGSGAVTKFEYARFLTASLAWLTQQQGDRVGLATFTGDLVDVVPPSVRHLQLMLHTLARTKPSGSGQLVAAIERIGVLTQRTGIVVLITDCYERPDALGRAIDALRMRGHDVIVFHIVDPAELSLPGDMPATFEDAESGTLLPLRPGELREKYQTLLTAHHDALARRIAAAGADFVRLNTSEPLDRALHAYLDARLSRSRVR